MSPLEDCDYMCQECGRTVCADERPSPGEPHTCDDCWLETAVRHAIQHQPPGDYSWNGDAA